MQYATEATADFFPVLVALFMLDEAREAEVPLLAASMCFAIRRGGESRPGDARPSVCLVRLSASLAVRLGASDGGLGRWRCDGLVFVWLSGSRLVVLWVFYPFVFHFNRFYFLFFL